MREGKSEPQTNSENKSEVHQIKDKFAREMFSHPELMIAFLEQFFPEVNPSGDWSSLRQEPGSLISKEFVSRYSDIIYSAQLGGEDAFVYFLIEHKSVQDYWTLLYLLELKIQIWVKWRKEHGAGKKYLPVIVPIILHQSTGLWTSPLKFEDYFKADSGLHKYIDKFTAELADLAKIQTGTILNWFLEAVLSLMKAHREGTPMQWLQSHIDMLGEEIYKRYGEGVVIFMLNYLAQSEGIIELSTIQQIATKISDNDTKSTVMTWAESLKQEGLLEGRQEGRQEGWHEGIHQGEIQGLRKGQLIGRIISTMERLNLPLPHDRELVSRSVEQLELQLQDLMRRLPK